MKRKRIRERIEGDDKKEEGRRRREGGSEGGRGYG